MSNEFTEVQIKKMIDFFKMELKEIKEKKLELEVQEREYTDLVTKFSNELKTSVPNQLIISEKPKTINGYNTGWSWPSKAKFVVENAGHALTTRDILLKIFAYEPELRKDKKAERTSMASLSATLSSKIKQGVVFNRYQPHEDAEYHYGLIEWFDNTGTIMEQYKRTTSG